jgi:hypothetical protein
MYKTIGERNVFRPKIYLDELLGVGLMSNMPPKQANEFVRLKLGVAQPARTQFSHKKRQIVPLVA